MLELSFSIIEMGFGKILHIARGRGSAVSHALALR